jgi:hypothetical protein
MSLVKNKIYNFCYLTKEELEIRKEKYDAVGYYLGDIITSLHIHDSIFATGIEYGEDTINFKLQTSLN